MQQMLVFKVQIKKLDLCKAGETLPFSDFTPSSPAGTISSKFGIYYLMLSFVFFLYVVIYLTMYSALYINYIQ